MIAPRWEAQPWFCWAVAASTNHYQLPSWAGVLTHGSRSTPAPKPKWDVMVFRFGGEARPQPSALSA